MEVSWCSLTKGVSSEVTGICVLAPANFTEVHKIVLQIDVVFRKMTCKYFAFCEIVSHELSI